MMQAHTKLIEDQRTIVAEVKQTMARIRANRAVINRTVTAARKVDKHASAYISSGKVYVSCEVRDLQGFKVARLTRVLERLERLAGVTFTRSSDWPEGMLRDFKGCNDVLTVTVYARLAAAPKHCQRVQTGVKREEYPVYELRCA